MSFQPFYSAASRVLHFAGFRAYWPLRWTGSAARPDATAHIVQSDLDVAQNTEHKCKAAIAMLGAHVWLIRCLREEMVGDSLKRAAASQSVGVKSFRERVFIVMAGSQSTLVLATP